MSSKTEKDVPPGYIIHKGLLIQEKEAKPVFEKRIIGFIPESQDSHEMSGSLVVPSNK